MLRPGHFSIVLLRVVLKARPVKTLDFCVNNLLLFKGIQSWLKVLSKFTSFFHMESLQVTEAILRKFYQFYRDVFVKMLFSLKYPQTTYQVISFCLGFISKYIFMLIGACLEQFKMI